MSLFLLAEDTHRHVENSRVVERHHAAVGPGLEMNAHALLGFVLAAEIVADGLHVDSQLVCDTLRATAGQPVLDPAQFVECKLRQIYGTYKLPDGKMAKNHSAGSTYIWKTSGVKGRTSVMTVVVVSDWSPSPLPMLPI